MNNRIPDGATTDIKSITTGMMVKVKGDPVLHECLRNDVYGEENDLYLWGLMLAHEPRMEDYDDSRQEYARSASYDFAHVDSVEYALPPIPTGYLAIERRDGGIVLVEVDD